MAIVKPDTDIDLKSIHYSHNHIDILSKERFRIKSNRGTAQIDAGMYIELDDDEIGIIQQQHGLSTQYLLSLASTVVKSGYKGRLLVTLINHGDVDADIYIGDAVAQLLILKSGSLKISS